MKVSELYDLLDAFKVAGYGGYDVHICYESGCSGNIDTVTLDLPTNTLYMGE